MSTRRGPPKHQNSYAWQPHAGCKKNETEVGGRLKPYSEITGVCNRCKNQIEWKRRYGKYKPLIEPAKCQKCSKRNVRQAYHNLCFGCAKDLNVCAKCSCRVNQIVGRDSSEVEEERKTLEEAIKNARERDRRTLLREMNKGKTTGGTKTPKVADRNREGELFPATSIDEYVELSRGDDGDDDVEDDDEGKAIICN